MPKSKKTKTKSEYKSLRENVENVPAAIHELEEKQIPLGQRVAEKLAQFVGSWRFIIVQTILFAMWITANVLAWIQHWDPYPFILLNLFLSFQAAYCGPIIMMAQNRQEANDRMRAQLDLQVNIVAEREIKRVLEEFNASRINHLSRLEHKLDRLLTLLKKK